MPRPRVFTRREAVKTAVLGAVVAPLSRGFCGEPPAASAAFAPAAREGGLRLGVATYSTRMMPLDATIGALKALRIVNAGVFRTHCDWQTVSVDEARAVAEKFREAGIAITGSGVVNLPNDEARCRQAFENVKAAGMATMVCKPDPDGLPLVERLAREYDQRLAIHNHGPEDKVFPSPAEVWEAIKGLDARIGFCLDVGHCMRAKVDPAGAIRRHAARVYDVHLKDSLAAPGAMSDIPTEIGTGRIDIRGILQALRDIEYGGVVAFEYEKGGGNPLIGLSESVGYMRGLLAAMS